MQFHQSYVLHLMFTKSEGVKLDPCRMMNDVPILNPGNILCFMLAITNKEKQ